MSVGNPVVRVLTLPDATTERIYPDQVTGLTDDETARATGIIIHSRGGFDVKVAFESGATADDYLTLDAGLYLELPTHIDLGNIYFLSVNAGGDTLELLLTGTMIGAHITAGPA